MFRHKQIEALFAIVTLFRTTDAFSSLFLQATLDANPPNFPFQLRGAMPAPWQSYQLSLVATAGEVIRAVDVEITGPMHQRWDDEDVPCEGIFCRPTPTGTPLNGGVDSSLSGFGLFALGPTENNSKTGSPLPHERYAEYGIGDHLAGAWGILNPQPVTYLAYIVVRNDELPNIQITVESADPQGNVYPALTAEDLVVTIPQPPLTIDASLGDWVRGTFVDHKLSLVQDTHFRWVDLHVVGPGGATPAIRPIILHGSIAWNSSNSALGLWTFYATAANAAGMDVATVTVNIIPEPATMTLVASALGGVVGFARRRGELLGTLTRKRFPTPFSSK
jgi:hypothetical protein